MGVPWIVRGRQGGGVDRSTPPPLRGRNRMARLPVVDGAISAGVLLGGEFEIEGGVECKEVVRVVAVRGEPSHAAGGGEVPGVTRIAGGAEQEREGEGGVVNATRAKDKWGRVGRNDAPGVDCQFTAARGAPRKAEQAYTKSSGAGWRGGGVETGRDA